MGYKMKTAIPKLLGINSELSTYDVPVFEKELPKGQWGACLLYTSPIQRDATLSRNRSSD